MLTAFFPWGLYLAAWICTLIMVKQGAPLPSTLLFYIVIFNGGIQGIWAAVGHLIFPAKTAQKIGWQSNGFQVEIGFANLSIGITGVLTYFFPIWAKPLAVFIIIYYGGCAYNHIKERIMFKNKAPCNSGPMLYSTIATVITLIVCL
jgi:hypothetical protein